jgi:hypothetical protein
VVDDDRVVAALMEFERDFFDHNNDKLSDEAFLVSVAVFGRLWRSEPALHDTLAAVACLGLASRYLLDRLERRPEMMLMCDSFQSNEIDLVLRGSSFKSGVSSHHLKRWSNETEEWDAALYDGRWFTLQQRLRRQKAEDVIFADKAVFCVSIGDFDGSMPAAEGKGLWCIHEDCETLAMLVNACVLQRKSFALVLTKSDELRAKLAKGIQLTQVFPDYDGDHSFDDAVEYLIRFILRHSCNGARQVPVHVVNLFDQEDVKRLCDQLSLFSMPECDEARCEYYD